MTILNKNEKCCYCLDLTTACYIIAYFLMVVHTLFLVIVTYMMLTVPLALSINDPLAMRKLMSVLAYGQIAFPICVSNTKFTITLLIGLHGRNILRIKVYLIFATCMAVVTVISGFALEFLLHVDLAASVSVIISSLNAYFIYTIWRYLKQIEPKNIKMLKETV